MAIVIMMTEAEARLLVTEIKTGIDQIGGKLLDLYDREGWKALGYTSWRTCVTAEFDFGQSYAYRLLGFEQVKRNLLDSPMGEKLPLPTKERQTRPLTKLPPTDQIEAWRKAAEESAPQPPTAKTVSRVVKSYNKAQQTRRATPDLSDFSQDDTPGLDPQISAAVGILEAKGWTCIPPEAAEEPNCPFCARPFGK